MSALLEALRLCQPLAPALREQVEHQMQANAHDAEEPRPVRMYSTGDFDQQVVAREAYYRAKYGDER